MITILTQSAHLEREFHEPSGPYERRNLSVASLDEQDLRVIGETYRPIWWEITYLCPVGSRINKKLRNLYRRWVEIVHPTRSESSDSADKDGIGLSLRKCRHFSELSNLNQGEHPSNVRLLLCYCLLKLKDFFHLPPLNFKSVDSWTSSGWVPIEIQHSTTLENIITVASQHQRVPSSHFSPPAKSVKVGFHPGLKRDLIAKALPGPIFSPVPQLNHLSQYSSPGSWITSSSSELSKFQAIIIVTSLFSSLCLSSSVFYLIHALLQRHKKLVSCPEAHCHSQPSGMDLKSDLTTRQVNVEPTALRVGHHPEANHLRTGWIDVLNGEGSTFQASTIPEQAGITPPLGMAQGDIQAEDRSHPVAINTCLPRQAGSLTAIFTTLADSPRSESPQSAAATLLSHVERTESSYTSPSDLSCSSGATSNRKSSPFPNGIHQPWDFSSHQGSSIKSESGEFKTCHNPINDRSSPESTMRRRSVVSDRLSSILRPSISSNLTDYSSKPLPVRRIKKSFGVGDDFNPIEEQYDSLSSILQMHYASLQFEKNSHAGLAISTSDYIIPSIDSGLIHYGQHPSLLPWNSPNPAISSKRHSFSSLKMIQEAKLHSEAYPTSNINLTHNFTQDPMPSGVNCALAPYQRSYLADISCQSLNTGFYSSPQSMSSPWMTSKIPLTGDKSYDPTPHELQNLSDCVSSHWAYKRHRHTRSAPSNGPSPQPTHELEPIQEMKLSVRNPDVERSSLEASRLTLKGPIEPSPSVSPNSPLSFHSPQAQTCPVRCPPSDGVSDGDGDGDGRIKDRHNCGNPQDRKITENLEAVERTYLDPITDHEKLSPKVSKLSKRKSWLHTSLSLRLSPQNSISKRGGRNPGMGTNRLRKSMSLGARITRGQPNSEASGHQKLKSLSQIADLQTNPGISTVSNSPSQTMASDPTNSPSKRKNQDNKSSSFNSLRCFFSKVKRSPNPSHPADRVVVSHDPPATNPTGFERQSPSPSSTRRNPPSRELFDSACSAERFRPALDHPPVGIQMYSPTFDPGWKIKRFGIPTNPYGHRELSAGDPRMENLTGGQDYHRPSCTPIQWKSRLNSVGSFHEELEGSHRTHQSGLIVTNPDMNASAGILNPD